MRLDTIPQHLSCQRMLSPTTQVIFQKQIIDWPCLKIGFHTRKMYLFLYWFIKNLKCKRSVFSTTKKLPFAEVAAAVEAQLRFAAEEEAAAASINEVYVLPEDNGLAGYGTEDDLLLAGYGEQDDALDAYTTNYGRF